jgi:hypothetical protein
MDARVRRFPRALRTKGRRPTDEWCQAVPPGEPGFDHQLPGARSALVSRFASPGVDTRRTPTRTRLSVRPLRHFLSLRVCKTCCLVDVHQCVGGVLALCPLSE